VPMRISLTEAFMGAVVTKDCPHRPVYTGNTDGYPTRIFMNCSYIDLFRIFVPVYG
jgi:hypothetical protein